MKNLKTSFIVSFILLITANYASAAGGRSCDGLEREKCFPLNALLWCLESDLNCFENSSKMTILNPSIKTINKIKLIFNKNKNFTKFINKYAGILEFSTLEDRLFYMMLILDPNEEFHSFEEALSSKLNSFNLTQNEVNGIIRIFSNKNN